MKQFCCQVTCVFYVIIVFFKAKTRPVPRSPKLKMLQLAIKIHRLNYESSLSRRLALQFQFLPTSQLA